MLLFLMGCQTEAPPPDESISPDEIIKQLNDQEHVRGSLNPFKLIQDPLYMTTGEIDYLRDNDRVFILKAGNELLVYPHRDMMVEVVNDEENDIYFAITYCPITRSGIAWNRQLGNDTLLLTASGYLYKDNLMPLDVNSGHIWSQMLMRRFQGNIGMEEIFAFREISTFPLVETTWLTVKTHFPGAGVYTSKNDMKSAALAPLEQELGIIGNQSVETFTLEMFPGEITLHKSIVNPGGAVVIAGSAQYSYMLAFRTTYMMEPVEGVFPFIMKDETGTLWNIFGEGVDGGHDGERLDPPLYYTAADWAWRDLFEQVSSYGP